MPRWSSAIPGTFWAGASRRPQIAFVLRFESATNWVSLGKYRRARLLRLSTGLFCQGAWGSQNQLSVPMPDLSFRHARNSKPRPKVINFRAGRGRGSITSISLFMKCVELRSLFLNRTAYRVFLFTSQATFIGRWARSKIIRSPSQSPKTSRVFTAQGVDEWTDPAGKPGLWAVSRSAVAVSYVGWEDSAPVLRIDCQRCKHRHRSSRG